MPFHNTTSPEVKLFPLTVKVKLGPPATAVAGESEVRTGTGVVITKLKTLDVAPFGVFKPIDAVPGLAIDRAGTDAVSCAELTKTVASAEPFQ